MTGYASDIMKRAQEISQPKDILGVRDRKRYVSMCEMSNQGPYDVADYGGLGK